MFQPSPNLKAGCNSLQRDAMAEEPLFQPSPNLKAGCNLSCLLPSVMLILSFNPHPTSRPGATIGKSSASL